MQKAIQTIASGMTWFSQILAELGLLGLLLVVFYEVVARYLLNRPTVFSVEISEYLLVLVTFLSAGWVLREDRHVRMLALVSILPERLRLFLDISTSLLVMIFCVVLMWKGGKTVIMAYLGGYHSSSLLNFPLWIPYSIIPFGAFILGVQSIVRIGDRVKTLKRSRV